MTKWSPHIVLILCAAVAFQMSCEEEKPPPVAPVYPAAKPLVLIDSILKQEIPPRKLSSAMIQVKPDSNLAVLFDGDMMRALDFQVKYLSRKDLKRYPVSGIHNDELQHTLQILEAIAAEPPNAIQKYFDFYQINTSLKKDKVRITGYYTPTIEASKFQTPEFQVPMLKWPKEEGDIKVPSPAAIESGALSGKGLELAWIKSKKELRNAQLQGSCMVQFTDGESMFLGFGGSVKGAGGTYVFFKKIGKDVLGSGSFPLTPGYSAAIDPRFIPLGAALLAELPVCDKKGNLNCYDYRVIFAQDRGGAIKTTKRMDLYCGIGKEGLEAAKKVNNYGRLWLILPKKITATTKQQ